MTTITLHAPEGSHVPARWADRTVYVRRADHTLEVFARYVYPKASWEPVPKSSRLNVARIAYQDGYYTTIRATSR